MKIKLPTEDDARIIYYSIRERLAMQQLSKFMNIQITNVSDEEESDSWDVITRDGNKRDIIEIKVRKKFSNDTKINDKWIFEYIKYLKLTEIADGEAARKVQLTPKFLVFFFDKVAIWDVNQVNEEDFFWEELRASSVNGYTNTKPKKITHLSLNNAQIIPFILDYDQLTIDALLIFNYRYPNTTLILNNYED